MSRTSGGFRLDLGEPWATKLECFCAAYYDGSKTKIIREALDMYIDVILAKESERRKRFDEELKKRRAEGKTLKLVVPSKTDKD